MVYSRISFVDNPRNLLFPAPAARFCRVRGYLNLDICCVDGVNFLEKGSPSQALPRQLSQRESQAVKFSAKVLGAKRNFPAVDLALPLGELAKPQALTERAHHFPLYFAFLHIFTTF